jgi:hypothetical protein
MKAISEGEIQQYWVSYFREHYRGLVHDQILEAFDAWKRQGNNRATLAKKLGRRPEQVTRWLAAPSNFEIDTVSDIALAMGCLPTITLEPIDSQPANHNGPRPGAHEFELQRNGDSGSSYAAIKDLSATGSSKRGEVEVLER